MSNEVYDYEAHDVPAKKPRELTTYERVSLQKWQATRTELENEFLYWALPALREQDISRVNGLLSAYAPIYERACRQIARFEA